MIATDVINNAANVIHPTTEGLDDTEPSDVPIAIDIKDDDMKDVTLDTDKMDNDETLGRLPKGETSSTVQPSTISNASLQRLDINANMMKDWSNEQKQSFIDTLVSKYNNTKPINTIHFSGSKLHKVLSQEQVQQLLQAIGKMTNITKYVIFHGKCPYLTSELLAVSIPPYVDDLMIWHFPTLHTSTSFIATIRQRITLQRLIINFPFTASSRSRPPNHQHIMKWGCCDVLIMAICALEQLHTIQIRCVLPEGSRYIRQEECIISPEAMVLLLNSNTIQHLYLENCGLIDDHFDEIYHEVPTNHTIQSLHLKDNLFSDDILYTMGRFLPIAPHQLITIDVIGVTIGTAGGEVAAKGMLQNTTLLSLQLESAWTTFDELFDSDDIDDDGSIESDDDTPNERPKKDHSDEEWMVQINDQLRKNNTAYNEMYPMESNDTGNSIRMSRKSKNNTMIPANPYIPPHQLVVNRHNQMKNKNVYLQLSNVEMQDLQKVVTNLSDQLQVVMKDVPSKTKQIVSKLSDNISNVLFEPDDAHHDPDRNDANIHTNNSNKTAETSNASNWSQSSTAEAIKPSTSSKTESSNAKHQQPILTKKIHISIDLSNRQSKKMELPLQQHQMQFPAVPVDAVVEKLKNVPKNAFQIMTQISDSISNVLFEPDQEEKLDKVPASNPIQTQELLSSTSESSDEAVKPLPIRLPVVRNKSGTAFSCISE